MAHRVTLIPGDGTGPELTEATRRVLEATGIEFDWDVRQAGVEVMEEAGTPLPEETLASVKTNGVALKGPITTPIGTGFRSVNVALRHELELYACLRPCKSYRGVRSRYEDVDVVIVRENTEDLYAGIEYEAGTEPAERVIAMLNGLQTKQIVAGSGISVKPMSAAASERIVRFAFEYVRANRRRKVTVGHKANVMKYSDGLFLETARTDAAGYPDVAWEDVHIDTLSARLVRSPQAFDVLLLPNLYGDILSDLCAGLVGGLGLIPGANIGWEYAVFEPVHGSAPDIAGEGIANPVAMVLSGSMMLRHLGELKAADAVDRAVDAVLGRGEVRTADLGGGSTTLEMAEALADEVIRANAA